jgi:outer membrane protein assembly factor BamD (BamD/ComL family)
MFLLLTACGSLHPSLSETAEDDPSFSNQTPPSMGKARSFFLEGKYSEAVKQYRRLLKSKDRNVAELSQYQIAYTLAFYKNPKKDFQEALNEFQLFGRRFPESRLKEDAANWVSFLNQYLAKRSENEKLRDDIKKLVDIDIEAEQKQNQLR